MSFRERYHLLLAIAAAIRYGFPSRRICVIGVTGTNGKTTVVHLLHEIFRAAGISVASASSLRFKINDLEEVNRTKMTMPGRGFLQHFLRDAREAGCRFAVLEVTSEGIKQHRHRGIFFRAAALTNLRPEHLEAHGGFAAYREAKLELFRDLPEDGSAVLPQDDPSSEIFARATRAKVIWFSRNTIDVGRVGTPVRIISASAAGAQLEIGNTFIELPLGGEFNVDNALCAAALAFGFGVSPHAIRDGLRAVPGIPGRLEFIQKEPFSVVVDYAHTPDALESVYQTLQRAHSASQSSHSALVCVFGAAGGGRDRWKRPELGKIAARYAREIILTSEDPDDEDPARIAAEIQMGIPAGTPPFVKIILDRKEAIRQALADARPGETVVITGMGAQPWFIDRGGAKIQWNEPALVRELLLRGRV